MKHRVIHVGTGRWGAQWWRSFLPALEDRLELVAAVDRDPAALIGLPCPTYTDLREAIARHEADFVTNVVTPAHHEAIADIAFEHGLHILSEKPIADTLEGSARIAAKARAADRKVGITMSHRFAPGKTALREELQSGRNGRLDYLVCRFTCDCRAFGTWGDFRHEMSDPLLVEGAIHHLDILADLAGAPCSTVYAQTWNPPWGDYAGPSQALITLEFTNGVRGSYEGAKTNAVGLNAWGNEYVRAECELATIILEGSRVVRYAHDPELRWQDASAVESEEVMPAKRARFGHPWLIEQFLDWLEGGAPMPTNVDANLESTAIMFAAVESGRTGVPVDPRELLARASG